MKQKATYRSRKHFFQQLQDYQQNNLLVFTTEQFIPSRTTIVCPLACTATPVFLHVCCTYELSIISPMVNPVLAIRPSLTILIALHHYNNFIIMAWAWTSSTLLVVLLCHVTQPRHACSFSSRVGVTVGCKLLCAQVLMSLAWWAT